MRHFLLLFVAFAMIASGGAMAAKKPSKDQLRFEEAVKLSGEKKYTEAGAIFDELCKKGIKEGCNNSKYNQGIMLFEAKKFGEAAQIFDELCKGGSKEACDNAKIAHTNHDIISKQSVEDIERQRRVAAFDAAVAQYKAGQYDAASAAFGTMCKEGMQPACQNEAAVLIEQSDSFLKAVKRPNGEDCTTAVIASDYCRPPMVQAVALLGRLCPSQSTQTAVVSACNKRMQIERFIAETDKQIGGK